MEAITHVNELGIEDVWVRSDSAAHQERILKTLSEWKIDGKPSPVRFAIGYKKTIEFRKEVAKLADCGWEKVYDEKGRLLYELAEVPFVSNAEALLGLPACRVNDHPCPDPIGRAHDDFFQVLSLDIDRQIRPQLHPLAKVELVQVGADDLRRPIRLRRLNPQQANHTSPHE